ncbi:MAG TPA: HD domain-containing protein, partial [Aggregatilineales bacterium]|nr:HD domain-containing protein [Aggregatilineales bacterium]
MTQPNFDGAKAYALQRLAQELNPYLTYHSLHHTRDDVAISVHQLAEWHGITGEDLLLLKTASYFHDIGFIYQRQEHEEVGVDVIRRILPNFDYSPDQIDVISGIIRATKMPQSPNTLLEAIMADADMNSLGRADFFEVGTLLRKELGLFGAKMTDEAWYEFEI